MRAVASAARHGTSFGAPTALEHELGERVRARAIDGARSIRQLRNRSDDERRSRRARVYRRDEIIKFMGCYHGHGDAFLVKAGSRATTLGVPTSPGVTRSSASDTLLSRWRSRLGRGPLRGARPKHRGDRRGANSRQHGRSATVRRLPAGPAELSTRHGAVLIFDEVISGFRASAGGAQPSSG